ncbi:MAG TPA: hypothetical protein VFN67_33720 [Polyangiales bacterium]|nr:hypothetical protein [Polyangiales bacterium]
MRSEALALLCSLTGACQGENLILGDGRAADSGTNSAAPQRDFQPPRVIAELESEDVSDDDPSLTADLLVLCFNSKRDGGMGEEDIWCSRRARSDEAWGAPVAQVALNTERRETGIALSLDGLSMWFSSDRGAGSGGLDVYTTIRPSRDAAWSEVARVTELSTPDDDLVSSVDETGLRLMLARRTRSDDDDDDAGDYDILLSQRTTHSDPWRAPSAVSELNSDESESDAFLIGPGLDLVFSRKDDLLWAHRSQTNAPFDHVSALNVLNSEKRERDAWSNSAFTYIVFSSDRAGSFRLYEAER